MKAQVTEEAVKDLLDSMFRPLERKHEILKSIRDNLSTLDAGRTNIVIEKTVADGAKRHLYIRKEDERDCERSVIADCLDELDYYNDKRTVLDAAIAECEKIETKMKRLKELRPAVKKVFDSLDDRTKAIFEIYDELMRLYGMASDLDYSEYLDFFPPSVNALRDDPALSPALEAYGLARDVSEILE